MSDHEMRWLVERVDRLERQNRRFKVGMLGAALVVAGSVLMAATAPAPRIVAARAFKLVDERGMGRATLNLVAGDPELALFDAQGNGRAFLFLGSYGNAGAPELQFDDANGKARAKFFLSGKGVPSFSLFGPQNPVFPAVAITTDEGAPQLNLSDGRGVQRARIGLEPSGDPMLGLGDARGRMRVLLERTTGLEFLDASGNPTSLVTPQDIGIVDRQSGNATHVGATGITISDARGNVWTVPDRR